MAGIEAALECPVCFMIPREVPIPCCTAGHIVCKPCRSKVRDCPTCRGRFYSNTSSVVAALIHQVNHSCKNVGCDVKMRLDDIVKHEKNCPERSVSCPYQMCKAVVQLKKFHHHVQEARCTVNCPGLSPHISIPLAYIGNPGGVPVNDNFIKSSNFFSHNNLFWCMVRLVPEVSKEHGAVYLCASFIAAKPKFVFSLLAAESKEAVSTLTGKMKIQNGDSTREISYKGPVLSIESSQSDLDEQSWSVHYDTIKPFLRYNPGSTNLMLNLHVEFEDPTIVPNPFTDSDSDNESDSNKEDEEEIGAKRPRQN